VADEYRWPDVAADLRDGLTSKDVVDALYAHATLRMDNRVPAQAPTLLAVCAPTDDLRLIVVICTRTGVHDAWTIVGAREATSSERSMWRKYTS
jgi:hypothetical protein